MYNEMSSLKNSNDLKISFHESDGVMRRKRIINFKKNNTMYFIMSQASDYAIFIVLPCIL